MGWEKIEPKTGLNNRPKTRITISAHGYGRHGRLIFSLVVPSVLGRAWDGTDHCSVSMGTGEHQGKIRIEADPLGKYSLIHRKNAILARFAAPASIGPHEAEAVEANWEGSSLIIDLPAWAKETNPREGGEDEQPAPAASPPAAQRLVTKNGAALGHQPHGAQLKEADRQTELARKMPESKPSASEPPPAWRGKGDEPVAKPITKGKINLIGNVLEAGSRVMSLKGVDERLLMEHLVQNMDRRPSTDLDTPVANFEGVIKSLRAKLLERKLPLLIVQQHGGYRLQWSTP